ncbi:energy transducer TonB [Sulfurimonas sp.]
MIVLIVLFLPIELSSNKKRVEHIQKSIAVQLVAKVQEKTIQKKTEPKPKEKPKPRPEKPKKPKPKKEEKPLKKTVPKQPVDTPKPIEQPVMQTASQTPKIVESVTLSKVAATQKELYYQKLYNTIEKYKHYPKKALRFHQEGEVSVRFDLYEDGSIHNFKIIHVAPYETLNNEVKRVFKKLKKFEKPPQDLQLPFEVNITINFHIEE